MTYLLVYLVDHLVVTLIIDCWGWVKCRNLVRGRQILDIFWRLGRQDLLTLNIGCERNNCQGYSKVATRANK